MVEVLDRELAGLDALELAGEPRVSRARRLWSATWPKLGAVAIALGLWQLVVWSGWKSEVLLPGPKAVFVELWHSHARLIDAAKTTIGRAAYGYAVASIIGIAIGFVVATSRLLRTAVGSFITGLQTMPSVVWVPMAIVLFKVDESAILFVVVLGAAPSIANGLISGIDQVPPLTRRAGRALGARGLQYWVRIVLPAAVPGFVAGLKQGWAFAWRSLMAGELIVVLPGLGNAIEVGHSNLDYPLMYAAMVVILVIGLVADSLVFGRLERAVNRRWGLAA